MRWISYSKVYYCYLPSRANSNYSDCYGAWLCVKKVSATRQTHYIAIFCAMPQPHYKLRHFYSTTSIAHTPILSSATPPHYSAILTTEINGLGPNFENRDLRTIKGKHLSPRTLLDMSTHIPRYMRGNPKGSWLMILVTP